MELLNIFSKKKTKIIFCPKCKSTDIKKEITIFTAFGAPSLWKCNNCDFKGHLFPEAKINRMKEIQKKFSKKEK